MSVTLHSPGSYQGCATPMFAPTTGASGQKSFKMPQFAAGFAANPMVHQSVYTIDNKGFIARLAQW